MRPVSTAALDAPIRLETPKTVSSNPYVSAENPSSRSASSDSAVNAAPLATNQT